MSQIEGRAERQTSAAVAATSTTGAERLARQHAYEMRELRLHYVKLCIALFLVGIAFGGTCQRWAHSCAPSLSLGGALGSAIDHFCIDSGSSRP